MSSRGRHHSRSGYEHKWNRLSNLFRREKEGIFTLSFYNKLWIPTSNLKLGTRIFMSCNRQVDKKFFRTNSTAKNECGVGCPHHHHVSYLSLHKHQKDQTKELKYEVRDIEVNTFIVGEGTPVTTSPLQPTSSFIPIRLHKPNQSHDHHSNNQLI